jgi:NAD(P)-dependent dehydrogenase (short-subunit alcohol dehydrogenase family)
VPFVIDLEGRRALVTGSGQGVGRAIALSLARAGAVVAVNDVVVERAQGVVQKIRNDGGKADVAAFDVTDWDGVQAAVAALGTVHILVNNAGNAGIEGYPGLHPFVESEPDEWDRFFKVNVYGVMHCTRAVLPGMIQAADGRIVTVVSDAARYGDANMAPYAAAKAGAAGFSRSVAREVGRHGITVNNVALGTIKTPTTEPPGADRSDDQLQKQLRQYIIRRRGEPEDVAGLVTYLVSPLASWITGQTYPVNGGYSLTL